jgi:hypothetical protein
MPKQYTINQPSLWKSSYLFYEGEKQVGQLEYAGFFRQRVCANMDGRQWRYVKSTGLKETKISVLPINGDVALAVYHIPALRQTGSLELSGTQYFFKVGTWKSQYNWFTRSADGSDDQPLITYTMRGLFKRSGLAEVTDIAVQLPDYTLLVALGLYLGFDVEASNAAAAGATTAAVSVATSS